MVHQHMTQSDGWDVAVMGTEEVSTVRQRCVWGIHQPSPPPPTPPPEEVCVMALWHKTGDRHVTQKEQWLVSGPKGHVILCVTHVRRDGWSDKGDLMEVCSGGKSGRGPTAGAPVQDVWRAVGPNGGRVGPNGPLASPKGGPTREAGEVGLG